MAIASVYANTVNLGAAKAASILGTSAGAAMGNASGKGPRLLTGAEHQHNTKRSLIQFYLATAGIPANSIVDSMTMSLSLGRVCCRLSGNLIWRRAGARATAACRPAISQAPVKVLLGKTARPHLPPSLLLELDQLSPAPQQIWQRTSRGG